MVFRSIYTIFAPKISNYMDIKELYKLYQQHPCITTDSRDCPKGSIFLALKGESFDGNKFAIQGAGDNGEWKVDNGQLCNPL